MHQLLCHSCHCPIMLLAMSIHLRHRAPAACIMPYKIDVRFIIFCHARVATVLRCAAPSAKASRQAMRGQTASDQVWERHTYIS